MSVTRRLISSFGATILGPVVTVLIQLINVPIMLRFWGPQLYGEWLILSAVPTYLLLSDMGFGNVAGSDMTIRVNAGDRRGAVETFQSTMALVLLLTSAVIVILAAVFWLVPIHDALNLTALSPREARTTLALLSVNCLVILQWSVITAAYRCSGRYALVMLYVNCIRIVEGAVCFVLLFSHARPPELAALMLFISLFGSAWLTLQQHRHVPWLPYGFRFARTIRIRELAKPAIAFMAFPACAALSTQGMTLVVGFILGPLAVAVFNPMRTLARIVLQISNAVLNSVWPELSAAFGQNDLNLARKLHRSACQVTLWFATCGSIALAITGPRLFALWTHGQIVMNLTTFYFLLADVLAYSLWSASSAVPLSTNKHHDLALFYLVCTSASLIIGSALIRKLGLVGAVVPLFLCDLVMAIYVVRASNSLLADHWRDFASSMFELAEFNTIRTKMIRHFR